jgi:hypothetical protein
MTIATKKLDRAKAEIELLDEFIKEQTSNAKNKAVLIVRYDHESEKHQIVIAKVPDLSDLRDHISITVGIIPHLLRSSLDNMTFDRAEKNRIGRLLHPKMLQFPICDDSNDYNKKAKRQVGELSHRDQEIIESFQPYHGLAGRPDHYSGPYIHQLSLLRDLSNSDKHRSVVNILVDPNQFEMSPIVDPIMDAHDRWVRDNPKEYINSFRPAEMKVGEVVFEAKVETERIEVQAVGYATSQIALDERRPAIPTLNRIHTFVGLIHSAIS